MRYLTSAMSTQLAASGARPVLLIDVTQRTPGIDRTKRIASTEFTLYTNSGHTTGATEYDGILQSTPSFLFSMTGPGGVQSLSNGILTCVNPESDGSLWTDLLDDGILDGATMTFRMLMQTGTEYTDDLIYLGTGNFEGISYSYDAFELDWADAAIIKYSDFPTDKILLSAYPWAPRANHGKVKPVILGDMTGQAFDVTTPATALWRHVPCPQISGMSQQYYVRDIGTSDDQEDLVIVNGVLCEIPTSSRTLSGDYIQLDGVELNAWVPPQRMESTTAATNPDAARTDDLDDYATVDSTTDILWCQFPGLADTMGALGADDSLVASDVTIYTVYSKVNSGDTDPALLTIYTGTSAITGHTDIALNGASVAVDSQEVGDHISTWSDLCTLSVKVVDDAGSGDGVYVYRVIMRVVFRNSETIGAWNELSVYRSQRGFIEDVTAATNDYQDGGYMYPSGRTTTALRNPADQIEAILRNKNWGLGLRAPGCDDSASDLDGAVNDITTTWAVDDGTDFSVGDMVLCDYETVRVTAIATNDLTVTRGCEGSRPTYHADNSDLHVIGLSGEVSIGAFRGAAGLLQCPGESVMTNGEMEGAYSSDVADSWTKYDPDSKGTFTWTNGQIQSNGTAQKITRSTASGTRPAVTQALSTATGTWYKLSFWIDGSGSAVDAEIKIVSTGRTVTATTDWAYHEIVFQATGASTTVYLGTSEVLDEWVAYDDVACEPLSSWNWDHVINLEADARQWFNDAFPEAGIRLIEDSTGRTAPRVYWNQRPSSDTWDADVILKETQTSAGGSRETKPRIWQNPIDDVCTGVEVRYGYDSTLGDYQHNVYVGCSKESTGQTVSTYSSGDITVPATTGIFPSNRWTSGSGSLTVSGSTRTTVTITGATFLSDGVQAGDWLYMFHVALPPGPYISNLTLIDSVDSNTQLTVRSTMPHAAGWSGVYYTCMPYLLGMGAGLFVPYVSGGPGTETTTIPVYGAVANEYYSAPAVGDVIWKITSDSEDRSAVGGYRDQVEPVRDNREIMSMVRLAQYGQAVPMVVESPRIQDRGTAVAVRDHLFDYHRRRYLIELYTSLATLDKEVGDVVTVEHGMVPGGSLVCEITEQEINLQDGTIRYRLKELR